MPTIFQRKMDELLTGLPGAQAYLEVLISEKVSDNRERLRSPCLSIISYLVPFDMRGSLWWLFVLSYSWYLCMHNSIFV